jgi:hypothetical protein
MSAKKQECTSVSGDYAETDDFGAAKRFLDRLYSKVTHDARLVLSYAGDEGNLKSSWLHPGDPPGVLAWCRKHQSNTQTYFGVGLRRPSATSARGTAEDVYVIPGLWFDADTLEGSHAQDKLPATRNDVLGFLTGNLPLQPSLVVDTGGGVHCYWLFKEPFIIEDDADRAEITALMKRFQYFIRQCAKELHGWKFDNTADLPRILRLPGTANKYGDVTRIIQDNPERHNPFDFDWLPELPEPASTSSDTGIQTDGLDIITVAKHYGAILTRKSDTELQGAHPVHGSSTGTNFNVNSAKQVWRCHRCNTGGDALYLVAIGEGIVQCDEVARGVFKRRPGDFRRTVEAANEKFGAGIEWRERAAPEIPDMYGGTEPEPTEQPNSRPNRIIYATPTSITQPVDECLEALVEQGDNLYQRDGLMVAVQKCRRVPKYGAQDDGERVRIVPAMTKYVQELASQAAGWRVPTRYSDGKQYYKPGVCPERIIQHIEARMSLPFPVLTGVTTAPTLRADGSVVDRPGYDAETGLYYAPARRYPDIPDMLTQADAQTAYKALCEPFEDYHFVGEHDRSAAIAAALSIAVRHLIRTAPLFGVSANVRGAGKGLLVAVCSLIATGLDSPKWDEVTDPEEERKRLLVMAMDGDRVMCIDNVTRPLGSAPLDRAITEPYVKGRVLGASKSAELELQAVFFATGNALRYRGDMARRVVPIVLSPKVERPEEREDFRHSNLLEWTREEHPRLLVAALTLLRAYILAGKPKQAVTPYGSFEGWSDLVRSALVWVWADDPCTGRADIEAESDETYMNLVTLFDAWERCYPVGANITLKGIVADIKSANATDKFRDLGEALLPFDRRATKIDDLDPLRLSRALRPPKGGSRIIDDKRLAQFDDPHVKVKKWGLIQAGQNLRG